MFSPSDYNDAVPQFTNGNYANTPLNPLYVEEPDAVDYNRGVEPLQTLPAQWWNWLCNKITAKLNKLNIYVKNIFDELAQLLSLVGITPDATEEEITTGQLKGMFQNGYPSFLSDNFKFESVLQGRTRGVMVPPTDTWDSATHTLSLSGGFGILDTYKKVAFATSELVLPNDNGAHYIVSDANGDITIEDAITENVILIGLCHDDEYLLCKDFVLNQGVDVIYLHKWFGELEIRSSLVTLLQSYYNTNTEAVETFVCIGSDSKFCISGGTIKNIVFTISAYASQITGGSFNNCIIDMNSTYRINGGTFEKCTVNKNGSGNDGVYIYGASFTQCNINVADGVEAIGSGTFTLCKISVGTLTGTGISEGTYYDCFIYMKKAGIGISKGDFRNCTIIIDEIQKTGSSAYAIKGKFYSCDILLNSVKNAICFDWDAYYEQCSIRVISFTGTTFVANATGMNFYFVHLWFSGTAPSLANVSGKAFVINTTTIKGL